MTDVSIIIVSYNSANLLEKCIDSIIEKTKEINYSIFIVDNASSDNSVSLIKEKYPDIYLIENKINLGFGRANNQVLKTINSKYAFLGGLRSAAQLISYEVSIALLLLPVAACANSFNLVEIVKQQSSV